MDLDDISQIKRIDTKNMAETLQKFPYQITNAIQIVDQYNCNPFIILNISL